MRMVLKIVLLPPRSRVASRDATWQITDTRPTGFGDAAEVPAEVSLGGLAPSPPVEDDATLAVDDSLAKTDRYAKLVAILATILCVTSRGVRSGDGQETSSCKLGWRELYEPRGHIQ